MKAQIRIFAGLLLAAAAVASAPAAHAIDTLLPSYHALRLLLQTTNRGWEVVRVDL